MCAMATSSNTDGRETRDKKRKPNLIGAQRIPIIGTVLITRPCSNLCSRALATIGQRSMAKPLRVSTDPSQYSGSLRAAMRKNYRSSGLEGSRSLAGCMSMRTTVSRLSIQICVSNTCSLRARAVHIRSMGYLSSESWPPNNTEPATSPSPGLRLPFVLSRVSIWPRFRSMSLAQFGRDAAAWSIGRAQADPRMELQALASAFRKAGNRLLARPR